MSQLPPEPSSPAMDAAAIGQLVREELDRSNKYLEFAQGQIEKDRTFFKHLYTLAFAFIAIIVAVAGVFSYSSVSQMRADIKAAVDTELERDKREIAGLTAKGKDAITEAQIKTTQELENVRTEVQKRIDTEFQSDNIAALVVSAARERTAKELTEIIRSEASTQVAKGIKEEGPVIQQIVVDQTKAAVDALKPTISTSVEAATRAAVSSSVAPIQAKMETYGMSIRVGNLATLAKGDDRTAFEYLFQIVSGREPESANIDLMKLADSTISAIIMEKQYGLHLHMNFSQTKTPDEMKKLMNSANPLEREAALDNYPDDKSVLPQLIEMIKSDGNLGVLYRAISRFNLFTNQSFVFWNTEALLEWWDKNRGSLQ